MAKTAKERERMSGWELRYGPSHIPICSGDHSKPVGSPGCCCLNTNPYVEALRDELARARALLPEWAGAKMHASLPYAIACMNTELRLADEECKEAEAKVAELQERLQLALSAMPSVEELRETSIPFDGLGTA